MNRRLQKIVTSLFTVISMVGLLGASQTVGAGAQSDHLISENNIIQPEGELSGTAYASEENIELLGHLGGMAQAIEVVGDYAYVGIGPEFAVFDVSDPANIQRVGWLVAAGEVMDIAIQGDYAYLAYQDFRAVGLQVVDIHRPMLPAPLAVKEFDSCGLGGSVEAQEGSAYFTFTACTAYGRIIIPYGDYIYRLDITYPANPVVLDTYVAGGSVNGIAASPGWLYALVYDSSRPYNEQNKMIVFDTSSPGSMVETASIDSLGSHIALAADYAFIAADNGLQVVDVSDPTQPTDAGFHYLPAGITGIYTNGATAYVTYPDSILILDVTDPLNPVSLGTYQSTGGSLDLSAEGGTAFSVNGWEGIEIFDTTALSQIGLIEYPENPNDLAIVYDFSYVAADDGFWVLDASDPQAPFPIAHMQTLSSTVSLLRGGSFAFLASPDDGIHVIDVSDPYTPEEAATFSMPLDLRQLVLVNNTLYVAAGCDGLHILDVSNPYQLEEIGAFTPAYGINAVAVSGRYAYLAASNDNLILLDISDPDSLDVDGVYDPPGDDLQVGSSVAVQGSTVLLGVTQIAPTPLSGYNGGFVSIVDVSDPDHPVGLGSMGGGAPVKISLKNSHADVAYEGWLSIYDISNPTAVQVLGSYEPPETITGMTVDGEHIYLYNQSVYILRYPDPDLPSFGGVVSHANHQPYPGVPVSAGAALAEKVSDMQGAYAFRGFSEGTYTLTPSLPGYVFSPPSRTVTIPPSAFGQNFTILPEPVQIDFSPGVSTTLMYTDTQGLPTWLDIPGDASGSPLTLQIVPTIGEGAPDFTAAGHAFELNVTGAGEGATGFVFSPPLTATIQYSPQDVAVITDTDNLALWWWDGAAWQDASQSCSLASEYSRDLENHTLSLPICQTGVYKLMGPTEQMFLPMIPSDD